MCGGELNIEIGNCAVCSEVLNCDFVVKSVLNVSLPYMQLLEHTKYAVQSSGCERKKETEFQQMVTRSLPETGLHFALFTVRCTSFPVPLNYGAVRVRCCDVV
jgi:hypothetical protein